MTGATLVNRGGRGHVGQQATSAKRFLNSMGVNIHAAQGYNSNNYLTPLTYTGISVVRDYASGYTALVNIFTNTGVKCNVMIGSQISDSFIANAITNWIKPLANMGALVSVEGANEPNNGGVTWNGVDGGAGISWVPVAQMQAAVYAAIKADPVLQAYPVFTISEPGAETNNVGLQFLTIPSGSGVTLMPIGTVYADYANCHNYVCSTGSQTYGDNQAWINADPVGTGPFDGLLGNYGASTWGQHFAGYTNNQLQTLPRVTTESGIDETVSPPWTERTAGVVLVNSYLAQFKRGWAYTFIYELIDQEGSNNNQGLYHTNLTPKLAATYIHNLTTIIADASIHPSPGRLNYAIAGQPSTVHDLLLQKANGQLELIVWGEKVSGSNSITVTLGNTFATVKVYDVTTGTAPVSTFTNVSSVSLTMTDHAFIIEI